jgi:hypothetical protein
MKFTALFHFTSPSQVPVLYRGCLLPVGPIQRASIDKLVSVRLSHCHLIHLESPLDIAL